MLPQKWYCCIITLNAVTSFWSNSYFVYWQLNGPHSLTTYLKRLAFCLYTVEFPTGFPFTKLVSKQNCFLLDCNESHIYYYSTKIILYLRITPFPSASWIKVFLFLLKAFNLCHGISPSDSWPIQSCFLPPDISLIVLLLLHLYFCKPTISDDPLFYTHLRFLNFTIRAQWMWVK